MPTAPAKLIANSIYQEVLPRVLSQTPQASLPQIAPSWLTPGEKAKIEKDFADLRRVAERLQKGEVHIDNIPSYFNEPQRHRGHRGIKMTNDK